MNTNIIILCVILAALIGAGIYFVYWSPKENYENTEHTQHSTPLPSAIITPKVDEIETIPTPESGASSSDADVLPPPQ
jgi:hypothetical protein